MAKIEEGRYTAAHEGSLVVFVIGTRINRWWAVHHWLPVLMSMGPMLSELYRHKELGFLDTQFAVTSRGPVLIQYWRSYEDLENYARRGNLHLEAWQAFNQKAMRSRHVGIFHETYMVEDGKHESVYVNMPKYGLGRAGGIIAATGHRETAKGRLQRKDDLSYSDDSDLQELEQAR